MANYQASAFYKVRKWMIDELYSNNILNPDHYTQSSPIIPIQQIPESEDNVGQSWAGFPIDAPFIVWDLVVTGGYDTDYWNCRDEVLLWIYDYDVEKIMEIKEFLYDLFHRFDLSATDINNFDDPDSPFQFHYFDVMTGLPTDEASQVLGRSGANLVVAYNYTRPIQSNGRFA